MFFKTELRPQNAEHNKSKPQENIQSSTSAGSSRGWAGWEGEAEKGRSVLPPEQNTLLPTHLQTPPRLQLQGGCFQGSSPHWLNKPCAWTRQHVDIKCFTFVFCLNVKIFKTSVPTGKDKCSSFSSLIRETFREDWANKTQVPAIGKQGYRQDHRQVHATELRKAKGKTEEVKQWKTVSAYEGLKVEQGTSHLALGTLTEKSTTFSNHALGLRNKSHNCTWILKIKYSALASSSVGQSIVLIRQGWGSAPRSGQPRK